MKKLQSFASLLFLLAMPMAANSSDVEGSSDHPLVGRFAGAEIVAYDKKNFDEFTFAVSPTSRDEEMKTLYVEGKATRIMYEISLDHSVAEVFRNYQRSLTTNGFELLFSCKSAECGYDFVGKFQIDRPDVMSYSFGNAREAHRYLVAKKTDAENGNVYVAVMVYVNSGYSGNIRTQVEVVREEALDDNQIVIKTAEVLGKEIMQTGHSTLQGIYFETDKAALLPESSDALQQIAALLGSDSGLKLYVVGHTDNVGSQPYNQTLSNARAASVVAALVSNYDISNSRMAPFGVGLLAPVASNADEDGRAKNRRVELVQQ